MFTTLTKLCTIWVGQFKLHANKTRFQRATLNKGQGADHKKVANSPRPNSGYSGSSNLYVNAWQGEVVIMGDFNEVRVKSDRFDTNFNVLGANIFNSFINSTGLEEVHLGGSAFTWCHKLLHNNHDPSSLHITSTWNSAPSVDSNGMRNLAGKLKFLKAHIKIWIKDNKSETVSTNANLKKELNQLDAVIDKGTGTEVEAEKRMEVLAALRNIDHIHSMDLAQKAKIKWSIEGDENSNFFHGILNKKRNQMNIRGITIDGVWKE
ncbi:RNA-directed DNA polymerase, eukaryota, partial [Tanacetum coccineum]